MKTKFETNVAQEVPKTRMSQEPGLPWKLDPEDLEKINSAHEVYKSAATGSPPLKTRAIFPILLLGTIFVTVMYFVSLIVTDNANTRAAAQKSEVTMSSLQTTLEKMNTEKNTLSDNLGQLEKRVNDLNAQKELFATVIESLTKKSDEPALQSEKEESKAQAEAAPAEQADGAAQSPAAVPQEEVKSVP